MKKQLINLQPVKEQIKEKLLEKYNSTVYMNTDTVDVRVDVKDLLEQYIAEKNLTEPTIYITTEAYCKMRKLVDDTATEIGWYGTVTKCPGLDNVYVIEDILVYPQKVTGATCEQDEDKMFEFEMSLTNEQVNHKRFHGHSHVNMGVTPSGVDENFYQDILSQVNDYFIITITNKKSDYTVRFYDVENNILYSDLEIKLLLNDGTDIETWYKEADEKLSTYTVTTPSKFEGSILDKKTTKSYTAADQMSLFEKAYDNPYDYIEDDDKMVWDDRFGYITKAEKRAWDFDNEYPAKYCVGNTKRGRPKKRR